VSEKDRILSVLRAALPELRQRWPIRSLALVGSIVCDEATAGSNGGGGWY
jgi:hypothetical protein